MLNYIIRRLLIGVLLVFIISIISFLIMRLTPGNPYMSAELNPKVTEKMKEEYRKKFHLDRSLPEQYWLIMRDMFSGKLISNKDEAPVIGKIMERLPASVSLNVVSLLISFGFGIPLGVLSARYLGRWPDHAVAASGLALLSFPAFWVAYMLMWLLVDVFGVPVLGVQTYGVEGSWPVLLMDRFWHLAFPAALLTMAGIAIEAQFVRASMAEALREDYIRTARAKGQREDRVFYVHALRNSLRPLVTGIGTILPGLIGGSVIIETIVSFPGLGQLGYQAIQERDYPILMTTTFATAVLVLLGNLIADVMYAIVDPRVRLD